MYSFSSNKNLFLKKNSSFNLVFDYDNIFNCFKLFFSLQGLSLWIKLILFYNYVND